METVFYIAYAVVSVYMLLLFIRILLSWLGGIRSMGRPAELLASITDPYLNMFRGLRFLRIGNFDFSPIAGLILLSLLGRVFARLAMAQNVTLGLLLGLIVEMLISAVAFLAFIFLILAIIRLVGILMDLGRDSHFMLVLDSLFQPLSFRLAARLFSGRRTSYTGMLITICIILLIIVVAGNILGPLLRQQLAGLPF